MADWIGSIDVLSYTQQLISRQRTKIDEMSARQLKQLAPQQTATNSLIGTYKGLQALLDTFKSNLTKLESSFDLTYQLNSSNTSVATVQSSQDATPGAHSLTVTQLAQAQSIASKVISTPATTTALSMTNTVNFTVGSDSFHVDITATDSLKDIADDINTAAVANNIGVSASIVNLSSGNYKLVIASTAAGVDNEVDITETGIGANALDITTVLTEAQNAKFTLDTMSYELSSNAIETLGMNFNLTGLGSSTLTVTGTQQNSKVTEAAESMVDSYNQIVIFLTKEKASMTFDSSLSSVMDSLRGAMMNATDLKGIGIIAMPEEDVTPIEITNNYKVDADGVGGALPSAATVYPWGQMIVNKDADNGKIFADELTTDFAGVKSIVTAVDGTLASINEMLESSTGSVWKTINDSEFGGLTAANAKLTKIQDEITKITKAGEASKDALLIKYGQLSITLQNYQTQSQFLASQINQYKK